MILTFNKKTAKPVATSDASNTLLPEEYKETGTTNEQRRDQEKVPARATSDASNTTENERNVRGSPAEGLKR